MSGFKRLLSLLCAVVLVGVVLVSGAPRAMSAQSPSFKGQTLTVATWGGDWKEMRHKLVGSALEKLTGARVEYVVGNPIDHLAKMIASKGIRAPFDVVEMDEQTAIRAARAGLLEAVDYRQLPNVRDLDAAIRNPNYVPAWFFEHGISYRTDKFAELGLPVPSKWGDLFNPKLAGRVGIPTLGQSSGVVFLVTLAYERGGSEDNVDPAFEAIRQLKVGYFFRSSAEFAPRFTSGDVWAAVWSNSRTFRLAQTGLPVAFARAAMKDRFGVLEYSVLAIPKDSPNRALAHQYMNLSLDPNVQYEMAKW